MQSTELISQLFSTCFAESLRLLEGFEAAPTSASLFDVGAVAEMVVLGEAIPGSELLQQAICDAAARWLRSGILEDLCMLRMEVLSHAALLAYLARRATDYSAADIAVIKRLCTGRLLGRSEMPVLTQQLTAAYFARCGIDSDFGDMGSRDLARIIDKRILRARSDEYDVMAVLLCAQLLQLEGHLICSRPTRYPRALLVQAIRTDNSNWVPVLAYACAHSFSLDEPLRGAALKYLLRNLPQPGELLPPPAGAGIDSEYIVQAGRGLRIRSTLALAFALCTLGDTYVEARASVAIG